MVFQPKYTMTGKVKAGLDAIERSRWLVENMLLMPRHEAWFKRRVVVSRASSTTRIEGADMAEEEVGKLISRGATGRPTAAERDNLNAVRAYEFVDYLSDETDVPLDELVIRQLNREFLQGAPDPLTPGRYRNGQNNVGKFSPPDQGDVPALMREFVDWLQLADDVHPVLRAGVAHLHFVAIHPFWDGNGRVARALATMVLQRSKFHFRKLLSLDAQLYYQIDDYFTAIERTLRLQFKETYDATQFLEFFVDAVGIAVTHLETELTDWHREMEPVHKALADADLNHRQADALIFALQQDVLTRSDYVDVTGVSPVTASRDLALLTKRGWLTAEGSGRARLYRPHIVAEGNTNVPPEQTRLFGESAP